MKFKNLSLAMIIALSTLTLFSCKKNSDSNISGFGKVELNLEHKIGLDTLQLITGNYTNANGDDFKINVLKYYLSNFSLTKANGTVVILPETYFLIDAGVKSTALQTFNNVPAGDYSKIDFIVGVDSIRNYTAAHTGVFDHSNGMYINQENGFIFLKLEGTSSKSTEPDKKIYFQVSGAKSPISALRKISISLPDGGLRVRENAKPKMHFNIDPTFLFKGETNINFGLMSVAVGEKAQVIANNYAKGMFVADHIHN